MKRVLKWLGIVAAILVALIAVAAAYVFVASEIVVARTYDVPLSTFAARSDSAAINRGERLATIHGCSNCHGSQLEGTIMYDEPNIARIAAHNLTNIMKEYTDAELERLIRHGVKRDGTSVWIMPAAMFNHLTDEDLSCVIAYLRSVPEREGVAAERTLRTLARIGIVTDKFRPAVAEVATDVTRATPDYGDPISHGRYLAMTTCTECHGADLQGSEFVRAPNLVVTAAYSDADFSKLMRTGMGIGNRDLGLMTEMGRVRFSSFTDGEVRALRTYLNVYARQGGSSLP